MTDLTRRRRDQQGRLLPLDGTEEVPADKRCTRCGVTKTLHDFPPDGRRIDGRMSRCRSCCAEVELAKRHADPDAARARDRSEKRRARRNTRLRERRATEPGYAERVDAIREIRRQLTRSGITTDVLYARDGGICHICGSHTERKDSEPDHVIPLARGGSNDPTNVRISHATCNRRKADKVA